MDGYEPIIERFMGQGIAPDKPKPPIEVVWRVIYHMHVGPLPADFQIYAAFSESEAYRYANERFRHRKQWRVEERYVDRESHSTIAALPF